MFLNDKHLFLIVLEAGVSKTVLLSVRASFLVHRWLSFHCVTWWRVPWISGLFCVCAQSCLTLCDPWTIAHQVPLSLEFSRQENWGGLPFPSPGDPPNPGIKPVSLVSPALASMFFTTVPPLRALILFMKAPSSWPNHPPPPKPHILIPVLLRLGFENMNFGRHRHSSHRRYSNTLAAVPCSALSHVWLFVTPRTATHQAPGILQARILEWVAMPSFKGSSESRDNTYMSCIAGSFFTDWAIGDRAV